MLWERVRFVVISECFTEFSPHVTHFGCFYVGKWLVAGRRLQRCLPSADDEQARATLRTEQRGTDSRVKEHKRQRKHRGVAIGGSGGSDEPTPPPPRAGKGPQNRFFFF